MLKTNWIGSSTVLAVGVLVMGVLAPSTKLAAQQDRKSLEAEVRVEFKKHLKALEERVEKMEAKVDEFKAELERRKANSEELIARRVVELLEQSDTELKKMNKPSLQGTAEELSAKGWQLWRKQEYSMSIPYFESAIVKDPQAVNAMNGLGWAQLNSGRHADAEKTFKATLKLQPDHPGGMNGIGQALLAQGKKAEAEKLLLEATQSLIKKNGAAKVVTQKMTASWITLIRVYLMQGNTDEAMKWIDAYLEHDAGEPMIIELKKQAQAMQEAK